jgi:hypothetical protein
MSLDHSKARLESNLNRPLARDSHLPNTKSFSHP